VRQREKNGNYGCPVSGPGPGPVIGIVRRQPDRQRQQQRTGMAAFGLFLRAKEASERVRELRGLVFQVAHFHTVRCPLPRERGHWAVAVVDSGTRLVSSPGRPSRASAFAPPYSPVVPLLSIVLCPLSLLEAKTIPLSDSWLPKLWSHSR
jgi:hypothetical protein